MKTYLYRGFNAGREGPMCDVGSCVRIDTSFFIFTFRSNGPANVLRLWVRKEQVGNRLVCTVASDSLSVVFKPQNLHSIFLEQQF